MFRPRFLPRNQPKPPPPPHRTRAPVRGGPDGRSAPEIVVGGFASLGKDPTGWLFGKPSELYSNAVVEPFVVDQAPHPHPHPTLNPEPPNLTPHPLTPNPYP